MDIEFATASEIKAFQEEKLREQIAYLNSHSPFYSAMFKRAGIDPCSIRSIEDLARLPFTDKEDLHLHNDEFLCCPPSDIIDYVTTSGTMGDPVTFGCTNEDLDRLALNEEKSFRCAGIDRESIVQIMTTLDKRFMAGMAYFLGLRKLGAGVVRVGNGIPELQWDTINRLKPTALMCVPSFILRLIEYAEQNGIDYRHCSVKKIIGIGEGLRQWSFSGGECTMSLNMLGTKIKEKWPEVELFATYSSTEMSATFSECEYGAGGHVHPELIIVEIVDDNGNTLPDGEAGEVVITTLGVKGMPLLRFKTGDVAAKITTPCKCGRNSYRLTSLVGRKHHMIKLKGTTLYPPAINDVLDNVEAIQNYVVVVRNSASGTDEVVVRVGLKQPKQDYEIFVKQLKDRFRARLRVTPEIEILPVDVIQGINFPPKSRKPVKFIDER